jgi:hypothetical protein
VKYFVDKGSGWFEEEEGLKVKVRKIGGSVIEEFVVFGQL